MNKFIFVISGRLMRKAVLYSMACGAICGLAFFVWAGSDLAFSSPLGPVLMVYAVGCGFLGMMTTLWGMIAVINRKNIKSCSTAAVIAILLGIATILFFVNQTATRKDGDVGRMLPVEALVGNREIY